MNHGEKETMFLEPISDLIWSCPGVRQWVGGRESGFFHSRGCGWWGGGEWHGPPASGRESQMYPTLGVLKAQLFAFIGIGAGQERRLH